MPVVLGVDVQPTLTESWAGWLAPDPQPFLVDPKDPWSECEDEGGSITAELRDTYRLWWGVAKGSSLIWISEEQFSSFPRAVRAALVREQVVRRRGAVPTVRRWHDVLDPGHLRAQADGHRFVWWPSLLVSDKELIVTRVVSTGRLPSRHAEVEESTWRTCERVLPAARQLAGTFPTGSTANCFGTIMEAADGDPAGVYDSVEPFVDWLASACKPGGDTRRAGGVLVWRNRDGAPVHAAVSIGDGWGLEKPSGDWHSPRAVVAVDDIVRMSRHSGERLERHTIRA